MADESKSGETSESTQAALQEHTAAELREEATDAGVSGTSGMLKDDLVERVADVRAGGGDDGDDDLAHGPGPDGGGMRKGEWAQSRGGRAATVDRTAHGDHLGVLRIAFGDLPENTREVSWAEWFGTFDKRRLNFIYQDEKKDGSRSTFHRLEKPEREDG